MILCSFYVPNIWGCGRCASYTYITFTKTVAFPVSESWEVCGDLN